MKITIDIETAEVSTEDLLVLTALVQALGGTPAPAVASPAAEPEKPKAKPGPKPKAKVEAAPEPEPTPEPTHTEPELPLDEDEAKDEIDAVASAVARATAMVSDGKTAEVRAALTAVGAKKVSEMDTEQAIAFLAELDA